MALGTVEEELLGCEALPVRQLLGGQPRAVHLRAKKTTNGARDAGETTTTSTSTVREAAVVWKHHALVMQR